jgi:uncharacterized protein YutE (UPF0331/DUF86 family)
MTSESFPEDRLSRILDAVETIEESIGVLAGKQQLSRKEYKANPESRDVVERRFVKMTEATIDTGEELLKQERGAPPESNPESMRRLDEIGVLSTGTAEQMAQAAQFRNVLSHTYGQIIDHDVVYNALQDDLERYRTFVVETRDYLDSVGAFEE